MLRLHALANTWVTATNRPDCSGLEELYAPRLDLYTAKLSRADAIERKRAIRSKHPELRESIVPPIEITRQGGEITLSFTKRVSEGPGVTRDYQAYLKVREDRGAFQITAESDEATDRNLRYPTCERLMAAILRDFIAREQLSADMILTEAGPDLPKDSPGELAPKYEFKVGRFNENGPRMEHRAWVQLDPQDGRLQVQCPTYSSWDRLCGPLTESSETKFVPMAFESDLRAHIPRVCSVVLEKRRKAGK